MTTHILLNAVVGGAIFIVGVIFGIIAMARNLIKNETEPSVIEQMLDVMTSYVGDDTALSIMEHLHDEGFYFERNTK